MKLVSVLYYLTIGMVALIMLLVDAPIARLLAAGILLLGAKPWLQIIRMSAVQKTVEQLSFWAREQHREENAKYPEDLAANRDLP